MNGRTKQQGTPIERLAPPPIEKHPMERTEWTQEQIEQHLAKYPAWKMRLPKKEPLYDRTIRPKKVGEQA